MKITQEIPQAQKEILANALQVLKASLNALGEIEHTNTIHFGIKVLESLLKYNITVSMEHEEYKQFTQKNNVDFPIYH